MITLLPKPLSVTDADERVVRAIRRCSFMLIVLLSSAAAAQSLWENTAYGMSIAEVQAAVPAAIVPVNPAKLVGGLTERLRQIGRAHV
jgi:hypothetical protein